MYHLLHVRGSLSFLHLIFVFCLLQCILFFIFLSSSCLILVSCLHLISFQHPTSFIPFQHLICFISFHSSIPPPSSHSSIQLSSSRLIPASSLLHSISFQHLTSISSHSSIPSPSRFIPASSLLHLISFQHPTSFISSYSSIPTPYSHPIPASHFLHLLPASYLLHLFLASYLLHLVLGERHLAQDSDEREHPPHVLVGKVLPRVACRLGPLVAVESGPLHLLVQLRGGRGKEGGLVLEWNRIKRRKKTGYSWSRKNEVEEGAELKRGERK